LCAKLSIERLEDRTVLSGNITASFNNGFLSIIGDAGDNDVLFRQTGEKITVQSETSTINGQPGLVPVPFNNVKSIGVLFFDGKDSVSLIGLNVPGAINIVEGTGNDSLRIDNSTFQQLDATIGREQSGARGNIVAELNNDVCTGDHLNLSLLNGSGVGGRLFNGLPSAGTGSLITVTMNALQFTSGGTLYTRADDGIPYFNAALNTLTPSSSLQLTNVSTTGGVRIVEGDHFQNTKANSNNVGSLALSVGNDVDTVDITGNQVRGNETVVVGNNAPYPTAQLPTPFVHVNGAVGTSGVGSLQLNVGSNTNPTVQAWQVQVINTTVLGNLHVVAGNGDAVTVDPTGDSGSLDIDMGDGGINRLESLTMLGVDTNDPYITFNSKAGDTVNINLTNVVVRDPNAYFFMRDFGHGVDVVNLSNVQVAGLFTIYLSDSGHNDVTAQNVHVSRGFIFGGGKPGNHYHNNGNNSGYSVIGFVF
jgi:hypothetical protein